jgi:hypothetical protein
MKRNYGWWTFAVAALLLLAGIAPAQVASRLATEAAEAVAAKFGAKVVQNVPALARKIEAFAARYGEEAVLAVRRVGPEAFALADAAGLHGGQAIRVLARYGEEGATLVLRRPQAMAQVVRYGDEAAAVLVKHPGLAEKVVEQGGRAGVRALEAVGAQNGRRVAMLLEEEVGKGAQKQALLDVIGKYGDRAASFVWRHKGALAVGTTLTVFLANPESFLNGTAKLAGVAAEATVKPLAEGVARGTNWTVILLVCLGGVATLVAVRLGFLRRPTKEHAGDRDVQEAQLLPESLSPGSQDRHTAPKQDTFRRRPPPSEPQGRTEG